MNFVYIGGFKRDFETELYIANALEANGHIVTKLQDSEHTSESALHQLKSIAEHAPTTLIFTKCQLGDTEFCYHQDVGNLARFLTRVRNETKIKAIICWVFDPMRREFIPLRDDWVRSTAPACDIFYTTDGGSADYTGIKNIRTLRQGFPGPTDTLSRGVRKPGLVGRLAHIGTNYRQRRDWITKMLRRFPDMQWFQNTRGNDLFDVCKSIRLIVAPPWPYFPLYWSNRIYVITGYGGCLATPEVTGMREEGWVPHVHYLPLPISSQENYEDAIEDYLELPEERLQQIREAAQKLCFEKHTYRHRCTDLVKDVERLYAEKASSGMRS